MKALLIITTIMLASCGNPHLAPKSTQHVDDSFDSIVYDFESDTKHNVDVMPHEFVADSSSDLFLEDGNTLIINTNVWNNLDSIEKKIEVYRILADNFLIRPETEIATMPGNIKCPRSLMHPKMNLFKSCFIKYKGYYTDELVYGEDLSDLR